MPEPVFPATSARGELLESLLRDGILYRSPGQPVVSRDGTPANWMLHSLAVTLTTRGAELAGRCVLDLLRNFEGRQIATYGLTGIPILQSCVLQSGGRYRGLLVRKEPKTSGACKIIEGPLDSAEPVVLVDDSISSGTSMTEACRLLETAGLRVEGGVFLVRFGWDRGFARLVERGYHVDAVYDIWDDFMTLMPGETVPADNPSKIFPEFRWSEHAAPEALHPADLARAVLHEYFDSGTLLRPPRRVAGDYDSAGGVWVSMRDRRNLHLRHARDGFWHFPGEEEVWDVPEGIVRAALRTAVCLPQAEARRLIDASSIAVTFFGALEPCGVGQLDNRRYGIVVRSRERRYRMGGALPRMPGIANEWDQFQHARVNNARLVSFEPYTLYRHEVYKAVEPGADWQPTGVPLPATKHWSRDAAICAPLAARARDIVLAQVRGTPGIIAPIPAAALPPEVDSLYVTVYLDGRIRGCMGSRLHDLDTDLRTLALAALDDSRFAATPIRADAEVSVSVSILYNALALGQFTPDEVSARFRHGDQCLMAWQGQQVGLLLPVVASWYSLGARAFAVEVVRKAGIDEPPYRWLRFDCATWLADLDGIAPLRGAFKVSAPTLSIEARSQLHAAYLARMVKPDGSLYERYEPFQNRLYEGTNLPRSAHAGWVLAQAHRVLGGAIGDHAFGDAAGRSIDWHLNLLRRGSDGVWTAGAEPSVSEIAFLLLALTELPHGDSRRAYARDLAATLWSSIGPHGRVNTHRDPSSGTEPYQDYYPAQALLALAAACAARFTDAHKPTIERAFRFYRHRFRYRRAFGQVSWMMRSFCAWHTIAEDPQYADLAFEMGDWILQYQQPGGPFLNDHQTDSPGYTTAVYLEGLAAAAKTAAAIGDQSHYRRYGDACRRGLEFLDELTIQPRDASVLPNPEFALGGLRGSVRTSEIRTDFVQHALSAILEFAETSIAAPIHIAPVEGEIHA